MCNQTFDPECCSFDGLQTAKCFRCGEQFSFLPNCDCCGQPIPIVDPESVCFSQFDNFEQAFSKINKGIYYMLSRRQPMGLVGYLNDMCLILGQIKDLETLKIFSFRLSQSLCLYQHIDYSICGDQCPGLDN